MTMFNETYWKLVNTAKNDLKYYRDDGESYAYVAGIITTFCVMNNIDENHWVVQELVDDINDEINIPFETGFDVQFIEQTKISPIVIHRFYDEEPCAKWEGTWLHSKAQYFAGGEWKSSTISVKLPKLKPAAGWWDLNLTDDLERQISEKDSSFDFISTSNQLGRMTYCAWMQNYEANLDEEDLPHWPATLTKISWHVHL